MITLLRPEPLVSDVLAGKDSRVISTKTNILATQAANLMATERIGISIGDILGFLADRDQLG